MYENIWFTYKARIRAHTRLQNNDFHSQLLLVWYALLTACLSVIVVKHQTILGDDTDLISALFSIALLAISLVVANRDFRGRALEMRRNYLDLHDLYRNATANPSLLSQQDVNAEYQRLLDAVENHAEIDDKYFRVFHSGLTSRHPTRQDFAEVYSYIGVRTVALFFMYAAPVVMTIQKLMN